MCKQYMFGCNESLAHLNVILKVIIRIQKVELCWIILLLSLV